MSGLCAVKKPSGGNFVGKGSSVGGISHTLAGILASRMKAQALVKPEPQIGCMICHPRYTGIAGKQPTNPSETFAEAFLTTSQNRGAKMAFSAWQAGHIIL